MMVMRKYSAGVVVFCVGVGSLVAVLLSQVLPGKLPSPVWTTKAVYARPSFTADGTKLYYPLIDDLTVCETSNGRLSTVRLEASPDGPPIAITGAVVVYEKDGGAHWLDLKTGQSIKEAAVPEGSDKSQLISSWGGTGILRASGGGFTNGYSKLEATDADANTKLVWQTEWEGQADLIIQLIAPQPVNGQDILVGLTDPHGAKPSETLVLEPDLAWGWKMKVKQRYPEFQEACWLQINKTPLIVGLPTPLDTMKDARGVPMLAADRYPRLLAERAFYLCSQGKSELVMLEPPPEEGTIPFSIAPGPAEFCIVTYTKSPRHGQKHQWWCEVCRVVPATGGQPAQVIRPQAPFARGGGRANWEPPRLTLSPDQKHLVLSERDQWHLYRWSDIQATARVAETDGKTR